jgi:homoserine kinase type II
MAVYTLLDRKTLAHLSEHYGLGKLMKASGVPAGSVNTHYLLETRKGKFFLKIDEVKRVPDIYRELDLLLFLRSGGFPCPQPVADRQGQYLTDYRGKPVSVFAALPGHALPEAALTTTHLEAIGRALASLHVLGLGYKKVIENRFSFQGICDLYQELKEKMPAYFKHLIHVLDDEFAYHQQYREDKLPKGIIHGDLFADNLLFRGSKLVGVLDFEAACYGKLIFDLATAVNALAYNEGQYELERFVALLNGYQSVRNLSLAEWDTFPSELRFSALRFTATRLKDFFFRPMDNSVRVNKDFRDFLERLQVLRRERPGGMDKLLMAMATGYDYRKYQKPASPGKHETKPQLVNHKVGIRQHAATK